MSSTQKDFKAACARRGLEPSQDLFSLWQDARYDASATDLQAVVEVPEETESPTFMGEPVILSKVNDGNRKRAECFLEIMVALNIVPGSDQWNKAAEATRAYIASPSPVGVGEEGETTSDYSAMRLRLIAEKLGLGKAIPKKNADLWACAFPVLGMIRREVEKLAAPQPPAAPSGDADDEKMETCINCGGNGVITHIRGMTPGNYEECNEQCPACDGAGKI